MIPHTVGLVLIPTGRVAERSSVCWWAAWEAASRSSVAAHLSGTAVVTKGDLFMCLVLCRQDTAVTGQNRVGVLFTDADRWNCC